MIKNYFFLNRFVIECGKFINGGILSSIFSQEKDKILFELIQKGETIFLEVSVNPGEPYINLRQNYSRAKKNTINFFPELLNSKVESIEIADDDRIIKIKFNYGDVYFTIRGKYTNVVVVTSGNIISSFKKIDEEELEKLKTELSEKKYHAKFNIPDLSTDSQNDYLEAIRKKFPIIGKEIILEVKSRTNSNDADELSKTLIAVISEIIENNPALFIDESVGKLSLGIESFRIFNQQKKEVFHNLISAQNYYLSKKYFLAEKTTKLNIIRRHIENDLKKISTKINNLKSIIEKGNNEEEFKKIGNLLLINLSKIKPGMEKILIEDVYSSGGNVEIKLNKKLPPKKNVEVYFDKSKAERVNFHKSGELLKQSEIKFKKLKEIENKLKRIDDLTGLKNIMKELKLSDKSEVGEKEDLKIKFKQYIIESKYNVYVGKDSKNNDLLTTKFAKQNDYWFHARGSSGSHVVLRINNSKEPVPKSILKKAASIAAFHSKAKTAGIVPVAYTFKKYVVKKKGDPAGTVRLLREDVLLVKPEIPEGCEYVYSQD